MKKMFLSGLFSVLFSAAAALLLPQTVLADGDSLALALDTEPAAGVEGADLAVCVHFQGSSVGAVSGELHYESGNVTFLSAEGSGEAGNAFSAVDDGERVRFVWGDAAEVTDGGEIARFWFSVDDRADSVTFSLDDESLTACRAEDGEVTYFELGGTEAVTEAVNVGASYEVNNTHNEYYATWSSPVTAALIKTDSGFRTVDKTKDSSGNARLLVKEYNEDFEETGRRYIEGELPLYGGFYASANAYYYLSGKENPNEDNSAEVFRITKYDTSWNRLGSASLFGANTTVPFDAGSARFAEYGNYLFIRTAHEMYKSSDGVNHQANVSIKLNTSSMTIASSLTDVWNISAGYVSHSFNQFIMVDDAGYVVTLDHGDAGPRSAALGRYGSKAGSLVFGKSASFTKTDTMNYAGNLGANRTNASLGGLAFSDSNYLTAGNSNAQDGSSDLVRNVYVSLTPKSGFPGTTTIKWLSDYPAGGSITASTPHLVKLDSNAFAVLWEEFVPGVWSPTETLNCRYAFIDGSGNVTGSGSFRGYLSDCVPIVNGGKICWYVTANDRTNFYVLGQDGTLSILGSGVKIDSAENENTGIRVSWALDRVVRYFNVYRRDNTYYEGDRKTEWEFLGTTDANSYLDTTAEAGHGYFYTIKAAVYDGEELPKAWDTVGTYIVRVPAPELISLVPTAAGPVLNWNAAGYESYNTSYMSNRYVVWRKAEGGDWEQIGTAGNGDNTYSFRWSFTDTAAESGKTYRYTVSASMTRRGQTFEGSRDETGLSILYLTQPAVTELTADIGGINVSWTAVSGAESYRVYRMQRSILEFVKEKESEGITASVEWTVAGTTSETSLRDTGAGTGEWYYIIQALSGSSESVRDFELSDPHIVFVPAVAFTEYGYSQDPARAYFGWMHSSSHSGYAVYRRPEGGEWSLVRKVPVLPAEIFYDESPLHGTVTEYTVTAFYTDGDGNEHEGFRAEPGVTIDLNKLRFYTVTAEESTYTGSPVTPSFRVVNAEDGSVLPDIYYTASFTDNVNKGTGTITVTGKGEYGGTITGTFEILPKALDASMIGPIAEQTCSEAQLTPEVTVTDGVRELVAGTDYTVSYGENIYPPAGTVTITGLGNYTGSVEKTFAISGEPIRSISLAEPEITMVYGEERAVPAVTYEPEFAADEKRVDWSSSNEALAAVSGGRIRAMDPGKAVITATVPGRNVSASADVRVLFSDVADPGAWYFDAVYWALDSNVTSGYGKGTFQPSAGLTRAQTVTFIYNLAGRPDVSGLQAKEFTDVSNTAWYYNAVKWAVANKITSGYGTGTFQPNAICNRAMIVTFLANYAKAAGTYKEPTTFASFKDVKATDWFRKSVDWAVENGITKGYGTGTFSPEVTCNRAMMVTFLKKAAGLPKV